MQRGSRVRIPPIQIGEVVIRQAHITSGDFHIFQAWEMEEKPTVLLGMDVLGLFDTLIIDYRRRELHLQMRAPGA